ncbi:MAG: DUF302 domain-containing protein [Solirubrobacteraceae bacterium]
MSSLIIKRSVSSYADTMRTLLAAIERRGLRVFARIDHAAAAHEVGMVLEEEEVVLFGNPSAGTPLMQSDRSVGIDLPLRILVWREGEQTLLGHGDPRSLSGAYDLAQHTAVLGQMANLLEQLVAEATGR